MPEVPAEQPPPRLPPKKDVFLALLEQTSVFVHLDPRSGEVRVPSWFKKQPQLTLQIGLNLAVPIRDLHVDEDGASCTLSFNRTPHLCFLPWPSVFALVGEDGRGMVWPDDVPAEVAAQQAKQGRAKKKKRDRPKLRAVAQDEERDLPKDAKAQEDRPEEEPREQADDPVATTGSVQSDGNTRDASRPTSNEEQARTESPPQKGRALPPYLRVVK